MAAGAGAGAGAVRLVLETRSQTRDHADCQENASGCSHSEDVCPHQKILVGNTIEVRVNGQTDRGPGCEREALNAAEGAIQIVRDLHILERHIPGIPGVNAHCHGEISAVRNDSSDLLGDLDCRDFQDCHGCSRGADILTGWAGGAADCLIAEAYRWTAVLGDGHGQIHDALSGDSQGLRSSEQIGVVGAVIATVHDKLAAGQAVHGKRRRRREGRVEQVGYLNVREIHIAHISDENRIPDGESSIGVLH